MEHQRNITKKQELVDIITKEKPAVLCIQETMLTKQTNFNVKSYNGLFKEGHINRRAHRGVSKFVHDNIPFKKRAINTLLPAIAARINIGIDVTLVSIYNSRSHNISENLLSTLFHQ